MLEVGVAALFNAQPKAPAVWLCKAGASGWALNEPVRHLDPTCWCENPFSHPFRWESLPIPWASYLLGKSEGCRGAGRDSRTSEHPALDLCVPLRSSVQELVAIHVKPCKLQPG